MQLRANLFVPACAFLASLLVYLLTLLKEPSWGDSAELALQAFQLGVTHPPGYPIHSLLGKIFSLPFTEPATGTGLMGALCTSLAVALLAHLVYRWSQNALAALLAAGFFAFSPQIWEYAVATEIYNVNLAFFALSLWLTIESTRKSSLRWTAAAGAVFGLSLGTYLANLLLIPAFWKALDVPRPRKPIPALLFTLLAGLLGGLVLSWNVLRAAVLPPLGTADMPTSLSGAWHYFSGAQYGTTMLMPLSFYLNRVVEHTAIFARNWAFIGLLFGAAGFWWIHRPGQESQRFWLPLTLIFGIDMGYFTAYRAFDYHTMVAPAYFVFGIWAGCGAAALARLPVRRLLRAAIYLLLAAAMLGSFVTQALPRWERSRTTPVIQSSLKTLKEAPPNAVLAADWSKFTVLLYLQKTRSLRPDLILIERNSALRHYEWGEAITADYLAQQAKARPLLIDGWDPSLEGKFRPLQPLSGGWIQIEALQP